MSGTRKVGSKLNGNSRNGAIDCQSFNPNLKAEKATKTMSIKPKAFQRSKIIRERRNAGMKRIIPAINATAMSPIPPGTAKPSGNRPRRQRNMKLKPTNHVRCNAINQRRSTIAAQLLIAGDSQ